MFINIAEDLVLVDSVLTTSEVHSLLESTGLLVFFKGFGAEGFNHHGTCMHCIVFIGDFLLLQATSLSRRQQLPF